MSKYSIELNGLDLNQCKKLSTDEMNQLFIEYRKTKEQLIKDRLVYANMKLVLSLVQRFNQGKNNLEDLFQVGIIGLIKAIDHFDVTLNLRFSTYAVPLILGEIKRYIRENNSIHIPRSLKDISYKILQYSEEYKKQYHHNPTVERLSKELGIEIQTIIEALNSTNIIVSLSQEVQNDGQSIVDLESQIRDKKNDYQDINNQIDLSKALNLLNYKEHQIIKERYYDGLTQNEIAKELFISQAQVSRYEKQALERLKKYLE